MEIPTSREFFERFVAAARRHGAEIIELEGGVCIARVGAGTRFAVLSGLHGDERSGPLAVLRWFEETAAGKLIPEGQELWTAPLVNWLGWDADSRMWNEQDLNRSFTEERAPAYLQSLMKSLAEPLPALYLDLHEDYTVEAPYYFVYKRDTHDLSQQMAAALECGLVEWDDDDHWTGSSETYVREMGCAYATTTEAPLDWPIEKRIEWHLRTIEWGQNHLVSFAGAR